MYSRAISAGYLLCLSFVLLISACKKEPCEEVICQNQGQCVEGLCECPEAYEGEFCENLIQLKFLGTYTTSYDCSSAVHMVIIEALPDNTEQVRIINLGDYACPDPGSEFAAVIAAVDSNRLTLPAQTVCGTTGFAGYTYTGTGTVSGSSISLSFKVSYESDGLMITDECLASMEK